MLHPWMPARNWTDIFIARGHSPISPGSFAIGLEADMVRKNNYMRKNTKPLRRRTSTGENEIFFNPIK